MMFRGVSLSRLVQSFLLATTVFSSVPGQALDIDNSLWRIKNLHGKEWSNWVCELMTDVALTGEIQPGDAKRVERSVAELQGALQRAKCVNPEVSLQLDSTGGSVEEALAIGRLARRNRMTTVVAVDKSCVSSCVFVFAAGVQRHANGKIGIHRPYFSRLSADLDYKQIQTLRFKLTERLKAYAREMDFSETLIDDMLAIDPSEVKLITDVSNPEYRIWGRDATFDEQETARGAALYGLTSAEFRRRRLLASRSCDGEDLALQVCYVAIVADLPADTAATRVVRYRATCEEGDAACFRRVVLQGL